MSYRRSQERNRRLKKLYNETKSWYGVGAYYDENRDRYIKYRHSSNYPKYLRNRSNRKVRQTKGKLNGGQYKKAFEYWWLLY